ncbi:non-ribosomal peptide synthetase, partial [Segetibacter aerophilus]|uniref:non-ribosomal peptide synthetase n=1 Tax=Segetibacter aerophilus TaxID=670293 RepID=UPI0011BF98D4
MFDKAIDILYSAKQDGIDIVLNEEELHVKLPKNRSFNKDLLGEIKGNKQQIIDFLKSSSRVTGDYIRIERFDRNKISSIPASFSQQRLWFIDQLEGSANYHIPAVLRLKGQVHTEALEFALKTVLERHEALRTVLKDEDGQVYQHILDSSSWKLEIRDDKKFADQFSLNQFIEAFQSKSFDLSSDFMLRAVLVTISDDQHILLVNMHHISSDGWSMSVLVKEVVELYSSFTENRPARLEPLPLQYADYSVWQTNHLKGDVLDKKLGYWRNKLEGVEPLILPTDSSTSSKQLGGGTYKLSVDKKLAEELQLLSQQKGATLFMTLLTAFKVLLYNYTNQDDICIGTPIAGRQQPEVANLIGNFVNTLALRSHISPDATFDALLQQVRTTTLEAYQNQEIPFERIVEILPVDRNTNKSPVFQVVFAVQNTPEVPVIQLGNLQLSNNNSSSYNSTKFDLTVIVSETVNGLNIGIDYGANLFAADTIERFANNFKVLLTSIVEQPQKEIKFLKAISSEEEQRLSVEFNDTFLAAEGSKSLIDCFEAQVAKTPYNTALLFGEEKITYKKLDDLSNQLAHLLISNGVKSGDLVPLCIDRSIEIIVGILGILKAGATYVPIDPDYPAERINFIVQDTKAKIVVTKNLQVGIGNIGFIIDLGNGMNALNGFSKERPFQALNSSTLAYVIYTSGSTGTPKGVLIDQASVVSLVAWHLKEFEVTSDSKATSVAGVGFDAFVWEIWPYLLVGASINIIDNNTRLLIDALIALYKSQGITHSFISTALVEEFVAKSRDDIRSLKFLLTGGDKLASINLADINYTLVNNYGPTENTVVATSYKLPALIDTSTPLIGAPISNTKIYITNNQVQLSPIGVFGEICIGGKGLAKGYLNRPELTAEKFIANPFKPEGSELMYKSGDLGRWLPNGNIEFLGRKDDQIKVRGHRVEIGEIEAVVLQSGLVKQVLIFVREENLVGFVITEERLDKEVLISYLQKKLPSYMVPFFWIELDHFPLTANGKIDKKALLEIDLSQQLQDRKGFVSPRNKIEVRLAQIWEQVLHVNGVGIYDNFFELGGHSLLALRLVAALEKEFLVSVSIKEVFTNPTIADLSLRIISSGRSATLSTI